MACDCPFPSFSFIVVLKSRIELNEMESVDFLNSTWDQKNGAGTRSHPKDLLGMLASSLSH